MVAQQASLSQERSKSHLPVLSIPVLHLRSGTSCNEPLRTPSPALRSRPCASTCSSLAVNHRGVSRHSPAHVDARNPTSCDSVKAFHVCLRHNTLAVDPKIANLECGGSERWWTSIGKLEPRESKRQRSLYTQPQRAAMRRTQGKAPKTGQLTRKDDGQTPKADNKRVVSTARQ